MAGLGKGWLFPHSSKDLENNHQYPGASFVVLNPEYSKPTHRVARTRIFIALGLCAVAPVGQLMVTEGIPHLFAKGMGWIVLAGALYIGGAVL